MEDPWTLMKKNISDPAVYKQIEKSFIKRARKTAIILGSFLVVAFIAVVYAYMQVIKVKASEKELMSMKEQLELQVKETEKHVAIAKESKIIAEEAAKAAYQELENCRQKK